LPTDGETTRVPNAAVRANLFQATNVLQYFSAELALGLVLLLNQPANGSGLLFRQLPTARHGVHPRLLQNANAGRPANAIDTCESKLHALLVWQDNACNTYCHGELQELRRRFTLQKLL
jgi:hypothetical protein